MPQTATNLDRPQIEMLTFTGVWEVPSIGLMYIWAPNLSVEISQALSVRNQQWHCNNNNNKICLIWVNYTKMQLDKDTNIEQFCDYTIWLFFIASTNF